MMELLNGLKEADTSLFLFLNGLHTDFWDAVMRGVTNKFTWIPLYLFLVYLVYRRFNTKVVYVLLAAALLILITDQLSVHFFKNIFQRYRPCHNLVLLKHPVHLIDGCGGKYGFVSSHATNAFAIAVFLSFLMKDHSRFFLPLMFGWASLVSYSRIYAGVHYPSDVCCGALLGALLGWLVYRILKRSSLLNGRR